MFSDTVLELFTLLPYGIATLVICFIVGQVLVSFFDTTHYNQTTLPFVKVLAGLAAITICYITIITGFKTIILATIPFILNLILKSKPGISHFKTNIKVVNSGQLLYLTILYLISFIICVYGYAYNIEHDALILNVDYNYYAQVSSFIAKYGIEGRDFNFFDPDIVNPQPYHYGLIWTNTTIPSIFNLNHSLALYLTTLPFLITICAFGVSALISNVFKNKGFKYLGLFILIFAPLTIIGDLIFSYANISMSQNLSSQPKVILVYILYALGLIYAFKNKFHQALNVFMIAAVTYIVAMPAITAAVAITSLVLWRRKIISKREIASIAGAVMIMGLYIFIFYKQNAVTTPTGGENTSLISYHISDKFKGFIGANLRFFVSFISKSLPYFIIAILLFRKTLKSQLGIFFLTFTISIIIVSSLVHALFLTNPDADQFITRAVMPFLSIGCLLLVIQLLRQNVIQKVIGVVIIVLMFIPSVNDMFEYWGYGYYTDKKVTNSLNFKKSSQLNGRMYIASINDDEYYRYNFKENFRTFTALGYLQLFADTFSSTPIDLATVDSSMEIPEFFYSRPFYKYVQSQEEKGNFHSLYDSQISFILDNDIDYLTWSEKSDISPQLSQMIDSSTIIESDVIDHNERTYYLGRVKKD